MLDDTSKVAIDIHLAEFAALREELLAMIKWRDQLVFISLTIAGALFTFAFSSNSSPPANAPVSRQLALYLIAPLSSAIGGIYLVNTLRIRRIGSYIRNVIRPRVNALLASTSAVDMAPQYEVLSWEVSSDRITAKWSRRILEWIILVTSFVFTGAVGQFLIYSQTVGTTIRQRLDSLQMPFLFITNCFMLLGCLSLLVWHLMYGRRYTSQSVISSKR